MCPGSIAGDGVTRIGGSTLITPTQLAFPGELTSSRSSGTGYSWKKQILSGISFTGPSMQETGKYAVAINGDTGLTAGTTGWFEPDAGRRGWVFIPGGPPTPTTTTTSGPCTGECSWE